MSDLDVHPLAKSGFVKGNCYHANRQSYGPEVVDVVKEHLSQLANIQPASLYDVLELGAGTGKFTQAFLPALPQGTRYLATEPSLGFLETLRQVVPGVETAQVSARSIPLPDQSVKMVVCGQCFHWFCDEVGVKEISRVLIPGGKLVMLWRLFEESETSTGIRHEMTEGEDDSHPIIRLFSGHWKDAILAFPGFGPPLEIRKPAPPLQGTMEEVMNHFASWSVMVSISEEEREKKASSIRAILQREFGSDPSTLVSLPHYWNITVFERL